MQQKKCAKCESSFIIAAEDVALYEKLSVGRAEARLIINAPKGATLTPPTFCPQCRLQRRLAWRNDRVF